MGYYLNKAREITKERGKLHWLTTIMMLFVTVLCFWVFNYTNRENHYGKEMLLASRTMYKAIDMVRNLREKLGIDFNSEDDPNFTGLIGDSFSPITTTYGSLEAKRTTTNPNFAALLVNLLLKAGVKEGDSIAIGGSGSFPALMIATLSAVKALRLRPIIICSLNSSTWGANNPRLTWLDMHLWLNEKGVFPYKLDGVSIGGDLDIGEDMEPNWRSMLMNLIEKNGIPFIYEGILERNVQRRMDIYDSGTGGQKMAAFVNIGGSWANMGDSSEVLSLSPGLNFIDKLPPKPKRGVIYEMAHRNIPVIHLLNIKGLSLKYGLPWDPIPLPEIGEGRIYLSTTYKEKNLKFFTIIILYFCLLTIIFKKKFPWEKP